MYRKIYLDEPNVGSLEKKYLSEAIDSGDVSLGSFISEFEDRFCRFLKVRSAVATQSGTAAIHLALCGLGIGKGDEVIVPALTFVGTVNPVMYVGAKPVFVDVDIQTWNIASEEIKQRITKKTKAIISVHLYGNPCNMDEITRISKAYNLYLIEDATESLGSKYRERFTGAFGDLGCFSFNGNKLITTGGGGMVVGNKRTRLDYIRYLLNQARDDSDEYYHPEIGFNYRMTNIESALGCAQLERLDEFISKKRNFQRIYREELKGVSFIHFQQRYTEAEPLFWFNCFTFEKKMEIGGLQRELRKRGVRTRRIFTPLTAFPPYRRFKGGFKNAFHIYERGLCLPSSTLNSEDDIYFVCKRLKELIA